jgi:hypothetical protein
MAECRQECPDFFFVIESGVVGTYGYFQGASA